MDYSPQQKQALDAVADWLKKRGQPIFRLFGYAGTGKTTLARHFAEGVPGPVYFAAFTGKAAYVLRNKGCDNATTLHQLIYNPRDKSRQRLIDLNERLAKLQAGKPPAAKAITETEGEIKQEERNLTRPAFTLNLDSELKRAALLVVDECSMVDEEMALDILSFKVPVLVLGDPAQLPPVAGTGYFTEAKPDVMLTEIHRQAKDNPILWMAHEIRHRRLPKVGEYGESRIVSKANAGDILAADQLLVGRNATRRNSNKRIRQLKGFPEGRPVPGDRLVCLRNNHDMGLLNGGIWNALAVVDGAVDRVELSLENEDDGATLLASAHRHHFEGRSLEWWQKKDAEEFDFGYALTCHKAQGSQWNSVYVLDESGVFRDNRWRWLYTAVTRASQRVQLST